MIIRTLASWLCWLLFVLSNNLAASPLATTTLSQSDIQHMLINEAQRQGVAPALVLAIAKVESDFNPSAQSRAGARGVMQIMPATALHGFNVASHDLYHADTNIRVGIAFIKQLLEQYRGNLDIALSHYNGGSAVRRANGELRVIPATREYVRKVKDYAQQYQNELVATSTSSQQAMYPIRLTPAQSSDLSYAQQMALDEQVNLATDNQQSEAAPLYRPAHPRIEELQQLREHNLTRVLGPKTRQSNIALASGQQASFAEKPVANSQTQTGAGAVRAYRDVFIAVQKPELNTKQQKVAAWEAIFN